MCNFIDNSVTVRINQNSTRFVIMTQQNYRIQITLFFHYQFFFIATEYMYCKKNFYFCQFWVFFKVVKKQFVVL